MRKRVWLVVSLLVVVALLVGGCAGQFEGMKSPRELTDVEKNRVVEIALSAPEVKQWHEKESKYKAELRWVAIVWRNSEAGEIRYLPFDRPETNPNYGLVPQEAVWYPGVVIHFGEPSRWVIQVAVDLTKGKAVDVMSSTDLSSPGRFPIPPPK